MPRLTKDQWEAARIKWEADPMLSLEALARPLGVSKQAVSIRAKAEGWARDPSMRDVARRAKFKADLRQRQLDSQLDTSSRKASVRSLAEDLRADVIERHRADWAEHRTHFKISDIATDFDLGKSAKISSEMLAIRQKGERDAYGLNETTASQAPAEPEWTVLIGQHVTVGLPA